MSSMRLGLQWRVACLCLFHLQALAYEDATFTSEAYTEHATRLRSDLMRTYDYVVPPTSDRPVNYSKAGTDVALEIRLFKVQGVDSSVGQMRLKVWVRMTWQDKRLSWDPLAYGNISQVQFRTTKETEIWLPDVQLYNANVANENTLDHALATVSPDGQVFWSRPGLLDTLCKFSGLVAFPFDKLSCSMEWAGWGYSGGFQGIELRGQGFSTATSEDTAGSSYQEYSIEQVKVDTKTNFYDSYPSEPWTIVKYTVKLGRASFYYSMLIILPTVVLTYLSFGVFFMSHEVGERLSFGITLVLVIEVMKGTAASFVPVCGELLWIDIFMLVSTVFCCASLLETMAILFLAFHVDENILPSWLAWVAPWCLCRSDSNISVESMAGRIYRQLNREKSDKLKEAKLQKGAKMEELQGETFSERDTERLIFFENLFYLLDSDSNGLITVEDAACMLSFVNLGLSRTLLEETLQEAWEPKKLFDCGDFLEICVELMWTIPFPEIKLGAENYISSQNRHAKRCHTYWLKWSKTVDKWCRFWVPLTYTVSLGVLMNLELTDYYASGDPRGQTMFEGVGPMNMSTAGILQSLITPAIGLLSILTWLQMRHLSAAWKKQQKEARKARECAPDEGRTRPRWTIRSTVRGLDFGPISSMPYSDESDSSDELMRESFQMNSEKEDMV